MRNNEGADDRAEEDRPQGAGRKATQQDAMALRTRTISFWDKVSRRTSVARAAPTSMASCHSSSCCGRFGEPSPEGGVCGRRAGLPALSCMSRSPRS